MKQLLIFLLFVPAALSATQSPADTYENIRRKYVECVFPTAREVYQQTYKNKAGEASLLLLNEKDHTSFLQNSTKPHQEEAMLLECVKLYHEANQHLRDMKFGEACQVLVLCHERLSALPHAMDDHYGSPLSRFKEKVLWMLDVATSYEYQVRHQTKCPSEILKGHPLFLIYEEVYPSAIVHEAWRQLIELHEHSNSLVDVEANMTNIDARYRTLVQLTFRMIYGTGDAINVGEVWEYAKGINDGEVCIYLADLILDSDYSLFDIDASLVRMMLYQKAKTLGIRLAHERQELELYYASPQERITLMKLIEQYVELSMQH